MMGDFCVDPNTHVVAFLSERDHPAVEGLLEYYAKGCSTRNMAIETLSAAQNTARGVIEPSLEALWEVCEYIALDKNVDKHNFRFRSAYTYVYAFGLIEVLNEYDAVQEAVMYDIHCKNIMIIFRGPGSRRNNGLGRLWVQS